MATEKFQNTTKQITVEGKPVTGHHAEPLDPNNPPKPPPSSGAAAAPSPSAPVPPKAGN